jgi:hypothetical protein
MKPKKIMIDDQEYIRADSVKQGAEKVDGLECVMVRTYSAGVHFGYLKRRDGKEVELVNSRRVWYWSGACSLSQLATEGSKSIDECKIAVPIDIVLTEAIEIIPMSADAVKNLYGAGEWKKN